MSYKRFLLAVFPLAFLCALFAQSSLAQIESDSIHEIEVRLRARGAQPSAIRVRLLRQSGMMVVAETFSGQEGQARFTNLMPGEYIVETFQNESFEASATRVSVMPIEFKKPKPMRVNVVVDLSTRKAEPAPAPGIVMADVDLNVPETALNHYRKGMDAARAGKTDGAVKELKAAVAAHPMFYSARLELGRQLRAQKRFDEAEAALKPLAEITPRRAEPRIEYGIVLLVLKRQKEAAAQLSKAIEIEEANWIAHLYIGWALLESEPEKAERHFTRALELNEQKAAQAHLSLARLAHAKQMRDESIRHLEAYLKLAPDAADAAAVRKLLDQLRK